MTQYLQSRRGLLRLALSGAVLPLALAPLGRAVADALPAVTVWKDASCGCCGGWVRHMRAAGFNVIVHDTADMDAVKLARGVPDALQACHTAMVGGYVVEGHVPASDVRRMLAEQPAGKGLAVPGMPQSAPGMDQPGEHYAVLLFGASAGSRVYAVH